MFLGPGATDNWHFYAGTFRNHAAAETDALRTADAHAGPQREGADEPPRRADVHREGCLEITRDGHGGREVDLQDPVRPCAESASC